MPKTKTFYIVAVGAPESCDEPIVFDSLKKVEDDVVSLIEDEGYTADQIQAYKLVPITLKIEFAKTICRASD